MVSFSATLKEVAIGIFADYGLTGHRIGEKKKCIAGTNSLTMAHSQRVYGLQLKFIESNVPFRRTFAPSDTSFLGVFSQDPAFFS